MRYPNMFHGAIRGLAVAISLLVSAQAVAWDWPVTGRSVTIGIDADDSRFQSGGSPFFRFADRSGGDVPVVAPVSGQVIFLDEASGSEPHEADVLVIRSANELWVILRLYGMTWSDRSFRVAEEVGTGDKLGRAAVVELEIYDRLAQRYVNPRALFPYTDRLPQDGLPPLTFLQAGVVRAPDTLMPGTVQIVVSRENLRFPRLPRRVYVLRDGLLQARHSFIYQDDTRRLTTPEGDLLLFETSVVTGLTEIEVEAHRFDGTVERRTVRLFVPDVSENVEATPLDTP